MYLLDTNVVSELRRTRPHGGVLAWLQNASSEDLFISVVTLAELQAGVELTRDRDPEKAAAIEAWIDGLPQVFNVLPMDGATFRLWARLMHRRPNHHIEDAMIAATALIRDFTVATRNVRDFEPFGARTLNPFLSP